MATHAPPHYDTNYILNLTLSSINKPSITRTLSVPSSATFTNLHQIISAAFSWTSFGTFYFNIYEDRPSITNPRWGTSRPPAIHGQGNNRSVRKYVIIRNGFTEHGQEKPHMPQVSEKSDGARDANVTRLVEIFGREATGFEKGSTVMEYSYYTDRAEWKHFVDFMGIQWVERGVKRAHILGGEGHPAPEDIRKLSMWTDLKLEYYAEMRGDKVQEQEKDTGSAEKAATKEKGKDDDKGRKPWLKEWYETVSVGGDPSGLKGERLWMWDREAVQKRLDGLNWDGEDELELEGW